MLSQCDRLEAELRKGRKMTERQIHDELLISNHTGRISDLRPKLLKEGLIIACEMIPTSQGKTGLYSLKSVENERPENVPGKGDAWEGTD